MEVSVEGQKCTVFELDMHKSVHEFGMVALTIVTDIANESDRT